MISKPLLTLMNSVLGISILGVSLVLHGMNPKGDTRAPSQEKPTRSSSQPTSRFHYCSVGCRGVLVQQLLDRGTPKPEHMRRQIEMLVPQ